MSPFEGLELGNYPQWRNSSFSMNPAVLGDFLDLCNNLKVMILFWIDNRKQSELDGCIVMWKTQNRLLIIRGELYMLMSTVYAIGYDGILYWGSLRLQGPVIIFCIIHHSCMKMGLIHDLGESIVGDITPVDDVTEEEKHERERVCNFISIGYL